MLPVFTAALRAAVKGSLLPPRSSQSYRRDEVGRDRIEAFIRAVCAERYGAEIASFAPVLVATETADEIVAAAGYRFADEPLFLERYLDSPVEQLLGSPESVSRSTIVEVAHLSAPLPGEGRRLILLLAEILTSRKAEWVVSTVTQELRQVLVRLGLAALAIVPARPDRLGVDVQGWGSYYEHEPIVMAGHLPTAMDGLKRRKAVA